MKYFRSLISHPFLRGTFIFTSLSFVASLFSYAFNFLLAHVVSRTQYGEYSAAISYFSLFTVPFGALSLILMKKIGQISLSQRESYVLAVEKSFYQSIAKYLPLIAIISLLVGVVLLFVSRLQLSSVAFVLVLTGMTFFITIYTSFFQAKKQFVFAGVFLCLLSLLKVLTGGVSAFFRDDLWELYLMIGIIHVLMILFAKWYLRRDGKKMSVNVTFPKFSILIAQQSFYIPVITFLGLVAMTNIDIMIVKRFFDAADVGSYAAISLLGRIILYVSLPLTTVAFAFFTDKETNNHSNSVLWISLGFLAILGVISVAGYTLFPMLVVKIIFGAQYLSISSVVWLAAVFGSIYSLATLLGQYWVAQHHPISMASLLCAAIQAVWLMVMHDTFVTVLSISIVCSTVLLVIYLSALIYHQRWIYVSA
ncbi:MAG: hypothetical protein ABI425_00845 [Patescibacteria group bacterium]